MIGLAGVKLTREGLCREFALSPDSLGALESVGVVARDADGMFDLAEVGAAMFRYGATRANLADEKLAGVASALKETLPALQRLSDLPSHASIEGAARETVALEISRFFTVFATALGRAAEMMQSEPEQGSLDQVTPDDRPSTFVATDKGGSA